MTAVAVVLLIVSWIFIVFGILAVFGVKDVFVRLLSASMIDTVANLIIIFALVFVAVFNFEGERLFFCYRYLVRFALLIGFFLITNPISAHVNIRSAYLTGVPIQKVGTSERVREKGEERNG